MLKVPWGVWLELISFLFHVSPDFSIFLKNIEQQCSIVRSKLTEWISWEPVILKILWGEYRSL